MKIKISSILIFISLIPLMIGDGIQYILKISSRNLAMLIAIEACYIAFVKEKPIGALIRLF